MSALIDCCGNPAFCERDDCFDVQEYQREAAGLDLGRTLVELVVPTAPAHLAVAGRARALIDATSADNECVHGKLPGDAVQTCGCWRAAAERAA